MMKILFLGANPPNTRKLDIEAEIRAIKESIQSSSYREKVSFERREAVDAALLVQSLSELKPDVLHFSGHSEDGRIVLRHGDGYRLIQPEMLLKTLRPKGVKLLFLNCCYSIADETLMAGAAQSIIGTTAAVRDDVAVEFAGLFYRKLCDGYPVSMAYLDAQNAVDMNQGSHSPFHRLGKDDLRLFDGLPSTILSDPQPVPGKGISRLLGSIHLHIDGAREQRLVKSAIAAHLGEGYIAEQSAVTAFIRGDQRDEEPAIYYDHTPGTDEKEELDYFSTTCLHKGPELPTTAQWQKIKAATREVLVQLNTLESAAPATGVVLELERVVGKVDSEGNVEMVPGLRLRDQDLRDMFDGQDLLFEPRYPKNEFSNIDKLYELHFSLDLERTRNESVAPLDLTELRALSKQAELKVGGWFLFDDKRRWAYRSNSFERVISEDLLRGSWQKFKDVLDRNDPLKQFNFTLRLIAEETVAVWKSPLKHFQDVYTVPELAKWEGALDPLQEFWVVAPNFLGDQDARVFEAMSRQLRLGARYVYFLKSNADARRWISFRADLKLRLQFDLKMDAYVVEFSDHFWDTNMTFVANPHCAAPAAMRLLTDRLNKHIIGGVKVDCGRIGDMIKRLDSALYDNRMNKCERVITDRKHDAIATVCLRFVEHPAEADWELVFDDLLAKQVSVCQGEIVRYGGHVIVVLFSGERGGLAGAVSFAREIAARIAKAGPDWNIRLGIGFSDGQFSARANGMNWSGEAIHNAKEATMGEAWDHAPWQIALTPRAGKRLSALSMKLWPDLALGVDGRERFSIRRNDRELDMSELSAGSSYGPGGFSAAANMPEKRRAGGDRRDDGAPRDYADSTFGDRDFREGGEHRHTRLLGRWGSTQSGQADNGGGSPPDDMLEKRRAGGGRRDGGAPRDYADSTFGDRDFREGADRRHTRILGRWGSTQSGEADNGGGSPPDGATTARQVDADAPAGLPQTGQARI